MFEQVPNTLLLKSIESSFIYKGVATAQVEMILAWIAINAAHSAANQANVSTSNSMLFGCAVFSCAV